MTLQILMEEMEEIEETTGLFSSSYKTRDEHDHKEHVYNIPLALKPAQQLLAGLGVAADTHAAITFRDVTIKSFSPKDSAELVMSADRIHRLHDSARMYINTDLCPAGLYARAMQQHLIKPKDNNVSEDCNIHWQNLAAGICHAQEIDLLVDSSISSSGRALTTARKGVIAKDAPAILLLSNPTLKFKNGLAKKLDKEARIKFIEGMYRNIFNAAVSNGRNYIAMPAGGLGKSGGKPEHYFVALMKVAKEFPNLNIIYHPDSHARKFDEVLHKAKPGNVIKATKNVVFIADKLTRQGKPCALFNPTDCDVVYGHCDVGENWRLDKNSHFDGKNYIGVTSTATLNSYNLNPHGFEQIEQIIERSLSASVEAHTPPITPRNNASHGSTGQPPVIPVDISKVPSKKIEPLPILEENKTIPIQPEPLHDTKSTLPLTPIIETPVPAKNTLPEIPVEEGDLSASKSALDKILETKSGSSGLFKPGSGTDLGKPEEKDKPSRSSFSDEQIEAIRAVITGLEREIQSCWPYPNKDLKQIKVDALEDLLVEGQTHPIEEAIKTIKKVYPRVMEGSFSTRTADLLDRLLQEARGAVLAVL